MAKETWILDLEISVMQVNNLFQVILQTQVNTIIIQYRIPAFPKAGSQ
jgi:hypothetical protein